MTLRSPLSLAAALAALALAAPARANTLPDGAVPPGFRLGGGLSAFALPGYGGALGLDYAVAPGLGVGLSGGATSAGRFSGEVHALYRLVEAGAMTPAIAVMGSLWGQSDASAFTSGLPFGPAVGFALSYPFLARWRVGLNLLYSPTFRYGSERWVFAGGPPGAGVTVGYALAPGLEATLGLTGYGELLGLRGSF